MYAIYIHVIVSGDTLKIEYDVLNLDAERSTVVNVTNHSYFNLSGDPGCPVYDHALLLNADRFCAVDAGGCPLELRGVASTPFDFTEARRIGDRIDEEEEQLRLGSGYDHSFPLRPAEEGGAGGPPGLNLVARVVEPTSRRRLEVFTTEPAVHLYSGSR